MNAGKDSTILVPTLTHTSYGLVLVLVTQLSAANLSSSLLISDQQRVTFITTLCHFFLCLFQSVDQSHHPSTPNTCSPSTRPAISYLPALPIFFPTYKIAYT